MNTSAGAVDQRPAGGDKLRVAFAGTPEFAAEALTAIYAAGHDVVLVLSQPDRPAGRGMKLHRSAVKQVAVDKATPVCQPAGLKLDGKYAQDAAMAKAALEEAGPDVVVVAAYGLILPAWFLASAPLGCLNIHASLLPRWRGAAPIHRAVEAGDTRTGITVMQMDAGLDTGPMLIEEPIDIDPLDTTGTLHDKLAVIGGRLIVDALALAARGELHNLARPQPEEGVTYAHKIAKTEAPIDWSLPADVIERRMRAFDPFPGCTTTLGEETIKCWRSERLDADSDARARGDRLPGTILHVSEGGVAVSCGSGALLLTEIQRPGGKRLVAAQFGGSGAARSFFEAGLRFEAP